MTNYNKEELDKEFCKLIFSEDNDHKSETISRNFSMLLELVIPLRKQKRWHIPYDLITKAIYNNFSIDEDRLKQLPRKVMEKFDSIETLSTLDQNEVISCRDDTVRHVNLAIHQKKYIDHNLKKVNKDINKTQSNLKKLNETAQNASKSVEKVKHLKDSIYSDFIAILGIFTAITFATFGGLQLVGNIFGRIAHFTFRNIGGVLMLGSIYLLLMYLILIVLLIGVSKLNDKNYHISNNSVYVLTASFITIFTFGFGLMDEIISTHILFWLLIILILIMWVFVIGKTLKKSA